MENQTRYDLNAAIEKWRAELAAQADLTVEVRRELETHLRDTIAGFQQRGLNDEESFWLAQRRVGEPLQLGREFVKANPMAVWRERFLWMAAALLLVSLWGLTVLVLTEPVYRLLDRHGAPSLIATIVFSLLRHLPFFVIGILLLRGHDQLFSRLAFLVQSRKRFLIVAVGWFALAEALLLYIWFPHAIWINVISMAIWPLALIVLITWLIPPQNQKTPKSARLF